MSNQLLPCPCCGGKPMEMQYDGILWVQCEDCALNTAACDASADYVQLWNRRATQPADGEALVFANELISGALEGGDFSGADIQELAVKHGLLREERREKPCRDEGCACAEYGFPTECYRKTAALAPPAAAHGDEAVLWIECDPSAAHFDRLPKDWQLRFSTIVHMKDPGEK